MRSALAMFVAGAVSGEEDKAIPVAAAIETISAFSLVHDDIIDDDKLRRGKPAVHVEFGLPKAILVGDALQAIAILHITRSTMKPSVALRAIEVLCSTVARMCEGEWQDITMSELGAPNELGYLSMIENKTASLFRAAGLLGAIVADADDEVASRFGEYGRLLGIAFQIQDDILGLVADERVLGKPVGSDIRQRKVTLPLTHFIEKANAEQKIALEKIAGRVPSREEVILVQKLFSDVGSLEYASQVAKSYAERAVAEVTGIDKQEPYGQLLEALARLSVVRRY